MKKVFYIMILLWLVLAACAPKSAAPTEAAPTEAAPTEAAPTATAAVTVQAQDDVSFNLKYGIMMSFTGGGDTSGGPAWDHEIRTAIGEIERVLKEMGLDDQITITAITEDDGSSADTGVQAATKLVSGDGVSVILGPCCSGVTVAIVSAVTAPNGVPVFTIGSSPTLTSLGANGLLFRTVPSDGLQGPVLAQVVADALGAGAIVNIGARNDAYGTGLADAFAAAYMALGGKIGEKVIWDPAQATFDTEAQKLTSNNPAGWVIIEFPGTFPNVNAALDRTGKFDATKSFGGDTMFCPQAADCVSPVGMRGTVPSFTGGGGFAFEEKLRLANADPKIAFRGGFELEGWDNTMIAFLAAVSARSAAPADLAANVHAVTDPGGTEYTAEYLKEAITDLLAGKKIKYVGATGPTIFDANGDITVNIFDVWQIDAKSGKSEVSKQVSYTP